MTSFTLPQLQRVCDIYARYLKVRRVPVRMVKTCALSHNSVAHAHGPIFNPYRPRLRVIHIRPIVLQSTRRDQLETMIHELIHFTRTPKHSKKFWEKVALWYNPKGTHMARALKQIALNTRPMPSDLSEGM